MSSVLFLRGGLQSITNMIIYSDNSQERNGRYEMYRVSL